MDRSFSIRSRPGCSRIDDLAAWCDERGIEKVSELIGAVRDDDMEMDTLAAASVGVH